ncbi:MAG: glycosyltransferase family 2 protein [Fusobacteria bacterium]|nr:glycosyltransferase family 2 protein [Fusobacteriota bacterium]
MKISTLITYYNGGMYFQKLLESLVENSHWLISKGYDHEIITIIDSMESETFVIEKLFQELQFPEKIKIIIKKNEANCGVVESRRRGLLEVSGDYIHIVDQDDDISDNFYELAVENSPKENEVIFFEGYKIDENGEVIKKSLFKTLFKNKIEKKMNSKRVYFYGSNQFVTPGMLLYPHAALKQLKEFYDFYCKTPRLFDGLDDSITNIQLLLKGYRYKFVPVHVFSYRLHIHNQRKLSLKNDKIFEIYKILLREKIFNKNIRYINRLRVVTALRERDYREVLKLLPSLLRYIYYIYL